MFRHLLNVVFVIIGHFSITEALTEKVVRIAVPLPISNAVTDTTNMDAVFIFT
jgi:hypothetical protein